MKILTELLPIGHAVSSARRNVGFPIEHDQIAVVCQGDRIGAAGNQFVGARGRSAVQRHFRNEPLNERLQFGQGKCAEGGVRHLAGIGLADCRRVRRELLAKEVSPFPHFAGFRVELSGRELLHKLVQNDAAQATALDQHWGVERRVFGGIRELRRQDIRIALTGFGPCDRRKASLDPRLFFGEDLRRLLILARLRCSDDGAPKL